MPLLKDVAAERSLLGSRQGFTDVELGFTRISHELISRV
jgi:hypothetical protein